MDLDQLKQILTLVQEHELSEFEIEQDGLRLFVRKQGAVHHAPAAAPAAQPLAAPVASAPPATTAAAAAEAADTEIELAIVKSPIVGTFYRSPEPGAASFVEVGSAVKKGQVLCIIEAMKLMNEIESDVAGRIVKINVDNGKPVEYNQVLFLLEPA